MYESTGACVEKKASFKKWAPRMKNYTLCNHILKLFVHKPNPCSKTSSSYIYIYILLMVKWTFDKEKFTHRITSFLLTRSIVVTNKMSEEIPVIPKVTSLTVHSGNIVNWNRLKRHPNHGATAEVKSCLFTSSKYSTEVLNLRSITHYIV